jgi:hypothetical protein
MKPLTMEFCNTWKQRADKFAQNSLRVNFSVLSVPSVPSNPSALPLFHLYYLFCSTCTICAVPSILFVFASLFLFLLSHLFHLLCSVPSVLSVLFHLHYMFCSICYLFYYIWSIPPPPASHVFIPRKKCFRTTFIIYNFLMDASALSIFRFTYVISVIQYIHVAVYVLLIVHCYFFTAKQWRLKRQQRIVPWMNYYKRNSRVYKTLFLIFQPFGSPFASKF